MKPASPARDPGAVAEAVAPERSLELADGAFRQGDVDGAVAHLSAAIRGLTSADQKCAAAMACVQLGSVFANRLGNRTASRAWFARARALVEQEPPCLEQGWVAVAALGCDVDDPADLLASAELALDRARRFGNLNLEMKALADAGLAHVQSGRIADGMALLDQAMALACGPTDPGDSTGQSVCSFFTACYYAADFERANSWADLLRRHGLLSLSAGPGVFLSGHCDSVQGTLLIELGRWADAEAMLVRAKADFETVMPFSSWHPDIALADLRVRQGRLTDAETLLMGKEQHIQALLPAARLHLARGDSDLARAMARRGVRVMADDRLRVVELLTVLVDAELARGDVDAATAACAELAARATSIDVPTLEARAAAARARTLAATGDLAGAVEMLEGGLDRVNAVQLPWLRTTLLVDLARLRDEAGDRAGATVDAKAAAAALATLDVVLAPGDVALLERLGATAAVRGVASTATLTRAGRWWTASCGGASVRLPDTKGLRYLAGLIERPGLERHVLDLVDAVEGVSPDGAASRRALGNAGPVLDARARSAYRHRIEELRVDVDDALAAGLLDSAEAAQRELDLLVAQLVQAFGLGGRDRPAASAAERARLNVTRAVRAAITKLVEALPAAGEILDRRVRTGLYCAYEAAEDDDVRWVVQS